MPYKSVEAQREYWRQYYYRNKEKRQAYDQQYYRKHAIRIKQRTRKWSLDNADKMSKYRRDWADVHAAAVRDSRLRMAYGISLEEYDAMLLVQGNVCAVCKQAETMTWRGKVKALAVDHDHITKKVRGLLCQACNQALGFLNDDKDTVIALLTYLTNNAIYDAA